MKAYLTHAGIAGANGSTMQDYWNLLQGDAPLKETFEDKAAQALLPDRKLLKTISRSDAIGLAAVSQMARHKDRAEVSPWRAGFFVGAMAASPQDNDPYMDTLTEANFSPEGFGGVCMSARPNTLLIGLPNNVLCYGSMLLDAKGPNSNYTSFDQSGMQAVINTVRRVAWNKLDVGYAAAFSARQHPIVERMAMLDQKDCTSATEVAMCIRLDRTTSAADAVIGYGMGPGDETSAIDQALHMGGVQRNEIGLVLVASCNGAAESNGLLVLSRVFANERGRPALGIFRSAIGSAYEATGLLEIMTAGSILRRGALPSAVRKAVGSGDVRGDKALIMQVSSSGRINAVLLQAGAREIVG